jgi:hypothetical protein
VKSLAFPLFALSLLLTSTLARAQDDSQQPIDRSRALIQPIGRVEAAKHPLQLDPPVGPQTQKLDAVKLNQEADELSRLAQSVPADIAQLSQGKLPKDMADKLKRIEKLSKHLRGELTP